MKDSLALLRIILSHKVSVWKWGRVLSVPMWRLLLHDLDKLRPSEWEARLLGYRYGHGHPAHEAVADRHHRRSPHHWQHWQTLDIPDVYIREMVADWVSASEKYRNSIHYMDWYFMNSHRLNMSPRTTLFVELYLAQLTRQQEETKA